MNFSELKLSEADRCMCSSASSEIEVRQYVLLYGQNWDFLTKSLTYYKEQLRLCEIPHGPVV